MQHASPCTRKIWLAILSKTCCTRFSLFVISNRSYPIHCLALMVAPGFPCANALQYQAASLACLASYYRSLSFLTLRAKDICMPQHAWRVSLSADLIICLHRAIAWVSVSCRAMSLSLSWQLACVPACDPLASYRDITVSVRVKPSFLQSCLLA